VRRKHPIARITATVVSVALLASAAVHLAGAQGTPAPSSAAPAAPPAAAPAAPPAGDADRAKKFKIAMCIGCHGIDDYHTAFPVVYHVPRIAGQNRGYIEAALKEYRSGERSHPSMRAVAHTLSDQDIADLAAYYSSAKEAN
jgi:cytochrome c553